MFNTRSNQLHKLLQWRWFFSIWKNFESKTAKLESPNWISEERNILQRFEFYGALCKAKVQLFFVIGNLLKGALTNKSEPHELINIRGIHNFEPHLWNNMINKIFLSYKPVIYYNTFMFPFTEKLTGLVIIHNEHRMRNAPLCRLCVCAGLRNKTNSFLLSWILNFFLFTLCVRSTQWEFELRFGTLVISNYDFNMS